MIGALKNFIIPYGVLQAEDGRLIDINEKPSSNYLVNTGVYIIEPAVISLVPESQFMNMTDLIVNAKNNGFTVGVYSFDGRWFDVGQWDEYRKTLKTLSMCWWLLMYKGKRVRIYSARAGSKGMPRKNIGLLAGKPDQLYHSGSGASGF